MNYEALDGRLPRRVFTARFSRSKGGYATPDTPSVLAESVFVDDDEARSKGNHSLLEEVSHLHDSLATIRSTPWVQLAGDFDLSSLSVSPLPVNASDLQRVQHEYVAAVAPELQGTSVVPKLSDHEIAVLASVPTHLRDSVIINIHKSIYFQQPSIEASDDTRAIFLSLTKKQTKVLHRNYISILGNTEHFSHHQLRQITWQQGGVLDSSISNMSSIVILGRHASMAQLRNLNLSKVAILDEMSFVSAVTAAMQQTRGRIVLHKHLDGLISDIEKCKLELETRSAWQRGEVDNATCISADKTDMKTALHHGKERQLQFELWKKQQRAQSLPRSSPFPASSPDGPSSPQKILPIISGTTLVTSPGFSLPSGAQFIQAGGDAARLASQNEFDIAHTIDFHSRRLHWSNAVYDDTSSEALELQASTTTDRTSQLTAKQLQNQARHQRDLQRQKHETRKHDRRLFVEQMREFFASDLWKSTAAELGTQDETDAIKSMRERMAAGQELEEEEGAWSEDDVFGSEDEEDYAFEVEGGDAFEEMLEQWRQEDGLVIDDSIIREPLDDLEVMDPRTVLLRDYDRKKRAGVLDGRDEGPVAKKFKFT